VHSDPMRARDSRLTALSKKLTEQRTAMLVRLFRKHRLHDREQVAAVCYRIGRRGLEFLLVQTRGGRWTFPKGGAEPGLTHAQAAALEAFEEAGVHGRIEQVSFARYIRKRGRTRRLAGTERTVNAHLCEVLRLGPPQEANRNPTWFSVEKAKRRLRQDRAPENGTELAGVVDRAVARIRRLQEATSAAADALQKVQFESSEKVADQIQASWWRNIGDRNREHSAALAFALNAYLGRALRPRPQNSNRTGARPPAEKSKLLLLAGRSPDVSAEPTGTADNAVTHSKNGRRNNPMRPSVGN
jgi:8-oxo-dGTP pyrophosphatase MutT (NUDIX family)